MKISNASIVVAVIVSILVPAMSMGAMASFNKKVRINQALFNAIGVDDEAAVIQVLADGADINGKNDRGESAPLTSAFLWNKWEIAKLLIVHKADVNVTSERRILGVSLFC